MSRHETLLPYDFSSLVTQPSEKQIICSACTLINALTLSGATISPSDTQSLISNVEQSRQPLELQQVHDFTQQHDSVIKFIPLPDKVTDITELVDVFTKAISKGPAMIAISTLLSKRNPTVPSRHEDQLSKKHRGKPIVHRVASIIDDNTVFIIDPYSPGDPELFDVTIREEKIRLAAWLFSVYFQKYPQSTSSHESRETLIPEALARLSNPKFIESENNLQLCKIEARIEQLTSSSAERLDFMPVEVVQDCWNDPQVVEEWYTRPMKEEIIDSIKSVISLEAKGLSENAQILDLACGANPFPYSPSDRQNIFMLDISPGMLKLNRSPIKVIADARRLLPFSNNTFEMVTCIFGMKYFENQEEVAADMLRILKPSGKAILIDVTRKKYKNGSLRLFMNRKLIERFIGENKNISVKSRILIRPFFGYPRLDLITITKTGSNVIHELTHPTNTLPE